MYSAEVGVLKEVGHVVLCDCLEGLEGHALESEVRVVVLSYFPDQALE